MKKYLFIALGLFFTALAGLGAVLPLLPTVPFLLLAAACFARSSKRLHRWLLNEPHFGHAIQHWQSTRSIPRRSKIAAVITIIISASVSIYMLDSTLLRAVVAFFLCIPLILISRIPTTEQLTDKEIEKRT